VAASKRRALPPYQGFRDYPPRLVQGAATGRVLAAQFRDGNGPAGPAIRELVAGAYAA